MISQKVKLDCITNRKIPRFSNNLLLPLEVQKLQKCFEESLREIALVASLPYMLRNLKSLKNMLGRKLAKALLEHEAILKNYQDFQNSEKKIEKSFFRLNHFQSQKELIPKLSTTNKSYSVESSMTKERSLSSEIKKSNSQLEITRGGIEFIEKQLLVSIKNILKLFSGNMLLGKEIAEKKVYDQDIEQLINFLSSNKIEISEELYKNTKKSIKVVSDDFEIRIIKKESDSVNVVTPFGSNILEQIDRKNDEILRLKKKFVSIEENWKNCLKEIGSKFNKKIEVLEKENHYENKGHVEQMTKNKAKNKELLVHHVEKEVLLRKQKFKIEAETNRLKNIFDQEVMEKDNQITEIENEIEDYEKMKKVLVIKLNKLEKEYNNVVLARKEEQEKREEEERKIEEAKKAASVIQAVWRSFKVRRVIRSKKKKKNVTSKKTLKAK